MKQSILEIYALAVCFVTLVCFATALGIGMYDLIEIANPEVMIRSFEYEQHKSNETFRLVLAARGIADMPEEEVTRQREESYQEILRAEGRQGMQSFLQVVIILVIDVLVFAPHWFLARSIRKASMVS